MVGYDSAWSTSEIFCQSCHRQRKGISLKSTIMSNYNISLDLCANCIAEIASETENLRH